MFNISSVLYMYILLSGQVGNVKASDNTALCMFCNEHHTMYTYIVYYCSINLFEKCMPYRKKTTPIQVVVHGMAEYNVA